MLFIMVQMETKLKIADNSGGVTGRCIQVYKKKIGVIGDLILVVIERIKKRKAIFIKKNVSSRKRVELGLMYKGIILNTKFRTVRADGQTLKFLVNSVVLISQVRNTLLGTRISGLVLREFRHKKYLKFILLNIRQNV